MLDVLIGLLQFLVENSHVLVCLGVVIFLSLMFLESDYVKHYGEVKLEVVGGAREKLGIVRARTFCPDFSCARFQLSEEPPKTDYTAPVYVRVADIGYDTWRSCVSIPEEYVYEYYHKKGVKDVECLTIQKPVARFMQTSG